MRVGPGWSGLVWVGPGWWASALRSHGPELAHAAAARGEGGLGHRTCQRCERIPFLRAIDGDFRDALADGLGVEDLLEGLARYGGDRPPHRGLQRRDDEGSDEGSVCVKWKVNIISIGCLSTDLGGYFTVDALV